MTFELTDDERDLLRDCAHLLAEMIADPARGVDSLRGSQACGWRPGHLEFSYQVRDGRLSGSWSHGHVVERIADGPYAGQVSRWRFDEPHRHASITMTRLRRWAESLPAGLRERARDAWAVQTRDIAALREIEREAVEHGEVGQLDLFEAAS